jgi:Zn-dependent protease with chaperone function
MPFLLLLFLTLVCMPDSWPPPFAVLDLAPGTGLPAWLTSPAGSTGLTGLTMTAGVLAAASIAWRARRQLSGDPKQRERLLRAYGSWRLYHLLGLFLLYGATLYLFGWGWTVHQFCLPRDLELPAGSLALVVELLTLAPFLLALVLSWTCFYDAERALHAAVSEDPKSFWSRWAYVAFHVRHNLALVAIPLVLLVLEKALPRLFPSAGQEWQTVLTLVGGVVALSVFITMPWVLRLVLGLKPLPDCPLRTRLLATAQRLKFRCSNILCWNTRGGVANAMVAGILPMPRYVLLTDRLIADLTPDEIEAVFGHEIGHVKHWHMLYYLVFLLLGLAVVWSAVALFLPPSIHEQDYLRVVPLVAAIGAYIFLVFGFLSRRCERQADIYGCRAVSCKQPNCLCHPEGTELAPGSSLCPTGIRTFIDALEKVAFVNGISRDRPGWLQSWQHSTIARRVEFLHRMLKDPALEPRFQRRVGLVKWSLLLGLAACLAVLLYTHSRFSLLEV